jgi:glycosyltransferase involved in cell wall biosynthesis
MHILKIVQAYYPFREKGGPVVKVRALARTLVRRGHQVTVVTADLGLADCNDIRLEIKRCPWGWRSELDGVQIIYLKTVGRYRALTFNPAVLPFCRALLKTFDLLHFYGLYDLLGPTISFFSRKYGIPYVIEPMGMNRPIDRSIHLKQFWHRNLGAAFWENAAKIIATSELEQRELVEDDVPPEQIVVRYNGVDAVTSTVRSPQDSFRARHGISTDEPIILFLSRLIPRKGADILIEAFAQACPESGRLVIAGPEGEYGYVATLKRRAVDLGVAQRVLFTGPIFDEEKDAVFADASIFALPSRYENFANVVAEAIAYNIPVVVTPFCGIHSLVGGRAGLIVPPEKEALAGALSSLIQNKSLFTQLQAGCREVVAQLSWDRLTCQMEDHYVDALKSTNGAH